MIALGELLVPEFAFALSGLRPCHRRSASARPVLFFVSKGLQDYQAVVQSTCDQRIFSNSPLREDTWKAHTNRGRSDAGSLSRTFRYPSKLKKPCRTLYDSSTMGNAGNEIDEPRRDSPVAGDVSRAEMRQMPIDGGRLDLALLVLPVALEVRRRQGRGDAIAEIRPHVLVEDLFDALRALPILPAHVGEVGVEQFVDRGFRERAS